MYDDAIASLSLGSLLPAAILRYHGATEKHNNGWAQRSLPRTLWADQTEFIIGLLVQPVIGEWASGYIK